VAYIAKEGAENSEKTSKKAIKTRVFLMFLVYGVAFKIKRGRIKPSYKVTKNEPGEYFSNEFQKLKPLPYKFYKC
jgi:hypothetical protein